MRDALGLVPEDEFIAILDIIAERRAGDVFPRSRGSREAGVDFGVFLTGLADMLRAQLAVVLGGTAPEVSERARDALEARRDRFAAADLLRMLHAIGELEPRFRKSGQQQLLVETLLVRFALLDRTVELEDVLRALGGGAASEASRRRPEQRAAERPAEQRGPCAASEAAPARFVRPDAATAVAPRASRLRALARRRPRQPSSRRRQPRVAGRRRRTRLTPPASRRAALDARATLAGRGTTLVERLRSRRASRCSPRALEHASPVAVTASGVRDHRADEANDIYAHAIGSARTEIAAMLREWFAGVERVDLRRDEQAPSCTAEAVDRRDGARRAHRGAQEARSGARARRSTRSISKSRTDASLSATVAGNCQLQSRSDR